MFIKCRIQKRTLMVLSQALEGKSSFFWCLHSMLKVWLVIPFPFCFKPYSIPDNLQRTSPTNHEECDNDFSFSEEKCCNISIIEEACGLVSRPGVLNLWYEYPTGSTWQTTLLLDSHALLQRLWDSRGYPKCLLFWKGYYVWKSLGTPGFEHHLRAGSWVQEIRT